MIIEFSGSAAELAAANRSKLTHAISELLVAHRKGHHFCIIPRETSTWLLQNIELGARELATLARVTAEYASTGGLLSTAGRYISIQVGHRAGAQDHGRFVTLGLDDVQGNYFFDRPVFVVEDQETDGKLYLAIAEACRSKVRAPNVALDVRHGGGERSKNVLRHAVDEGRICILITDSDRKYPQVGEPAKILGVRREIQETGWKLAWIEYTPCREIENLIPIDVVEGLPCAAARVDLLAALRSIQVKESESGVPHSERFWWYYDLKVGVDLVQLDKVSPDVVRDWTRGKMALAEASYSGISSSLVPQLLDDKAQLPAFLTLVKKSDWWDWFGQIVQGLLWTGFASTLQRT